MSGLAIGAPPPAPSPDAAHSLQNCFDMIHASSPDCSPSYSWAHERPVPVIASSLTKSASLLCMGTTRAYGLNTRGAMPS